MRIYILLLFSERNIDSAALNKARNKKFTNQKVDQSV